MGEEYKCTLTAASLQRAKQELHEDPKNRQGAVETFRKWILEQNYIKCPTDTWFLLPFLRTKKFSQLESRNLLQKFLIRREKKAAFFHDFDPSDPGVKAVLDDGLVLVLPGRDPEGRKVFLLRPGRIDTTWSKYSKAQAFRTFGMVLDGLYFTDENTQVNGTVTVLDFQHYGMNHQTHISVSDRKDFIMTWQGSYPARIKQIHLYNAGTFLEILLGLVKLIMTEKMRSRLKLHGDMMESVYKEVPMEMFPEEYLPDDYTGPTAGTEKQITDQMHQWLMSPEVSSRIKNVSSSQHSVDQSKMAPDVPQESFRKLNID